MNSSTSKYGNKGFLQALVHFYQLCRDLSLHTYSYIVNKNCTKIANDVGDTYHDLSLHPGHGQHSRTITGPQVNPYPGWLQVED